MYFRSGVTKQKPLIKKKNQELHTYSVLYILSWIEIWSNTVVGGEKLFITRRKTFEKVQKATTADSMHMWERD